MDNINFQDYFKKYNINVSRETCNDLELFVELIIQENSLINLISRKNTNKHYIMERHIIDSLQILDFIDFYNEKIVDLGSGSGILSILLSKIGFNSVHSCEIDDFARKESLINLKKNLVQDKVEFVDFPSNLKTKYSLIVSNISGEYLEKNFGYIVSKLMERGIFIISGLNKSKKESFTNLASIENIKILDVLVSGSWMAMIFEK